jgi:GntR family transcriptional regulator
MHGPKPFATESISLPASVFPGFADRKDPPDTLYDVFKRDYGVLVTRTEERITAAAADAKAASELTIEPDTPLLRIERIATALDGRAVEWRVSLYHLPRGHYRSITE